MRLEVWGRPALERYLENGGAAVSVVWLDAASPDAGVQRSIWENVAAVARAGAGAAVVCAARRTEEMHIRTIPDFPKPGIVFKDITPILSDPQLLRIAVDLMAERHAGKKLDKIAVIDARGFIFGSALAYTLGVGLIPIR